jgi:Neutral/alkaline non-lysosomal ceramidase, N-terminal
MKTFARYFLLLLIAAIPTLANGSIHVGIGKTNITPPIGTPSAGYRERQGEGMQGVHDPLFAIALFIDNGTKQIALCSVDHLGFSYEMVQEITRQIHRIPLLEQCEIYIASSHTHSGGGAYLNIPQIGQALAGIYDEEIANFYIEKTVDAIVQASQNQTPAKIGIGYGEAEGLSQYRALWPADVNPVTDVAVVKVTKLDNSPLAILFNYAVHPTVLTSQNRLFSADFVGYARDHLQTLLGSNVQPIYFNGAQGDIAPVIWNEEDRFASCEYLGRSIAKIAEEIWNETEVYDSLEIKTRVEPYAIIPQPTPFGLSLPLDRYKSEINILIFNQRNAFVTIPGELSTIYEQYLKKIGKELGYAHVSIFGLTNDAHGYIILPESWRHKTAESGLSFGGENYGELIKSRVENLLKCYAPR